MKTISLLFDVLPDSLILGAIHVPGASIMSRNS